MNEQIVIPPRLGSTPTKPRRFLVAVPILDYLRVAEEAAVRDTDLVTMAGMVISQWVALGCPDHIAAVDASANAENATQA